ncbi:MAG: DUF4404 family protein [Pseudomonadota bacterium]
MKNDTARLVEELRQELQTAGELDPDTRELLRQIHDDLQAGPGEKAMTMVRELEGRFAATHPVADKIVRVLMDSLTKMGI